MANISRMFRFITLHCSTVVFYVLKQCGITARLTGTNLLNAKSSDDTTNGFYLGPVYMEVWDTK